MHRAPGCLRGLAKELEIARLIAHCLYCHVELVAHRRWAFRAEIQHNHEKSKRKYLQIFELRGRGGEWWI